MIRKQAPHRYVLVTSGSGVKETQQDWTHEYDHLVWCSHCRNHRSIEHRDAHAAEADGVRRTVPLKEHQVRCECGRPMMRQSKHCLACSNQLRARCR